MSRKCDHYLALLPEYLDEDLKSADRIKLEKHLAACSFCRQELDKQKEWLRHRQHIRDLQQNRQMPLYLNERIMAAVRSEQKPGTFRRLPAVDWKHALPRLATVAMMVFLVLAAMRLFQPKSQMPALTTAAAYFDSQAEQGQSGKSGHQDLTESRETTRAAMTKNESASLPGSGWQLYTGALTELNGPCVPATDATTAGSQSFSLPVVQDILEEADSKYILRQTSQPARLMILSAWSGDVVDKQVQALKKAFATCATPVRIEIIKSEDLPVKLNQLEEHLSARVFAQPPVSGLFWIYVLIGE